MYIKELPQKLNFQPPMPDRITLREILEEVNKFPKSLARRILEHRLFSGRLPKELPIFLLSLGELEKDFLGRITWEKNIFEVLLVLLTLIRIPWKYLASK